MTRHAVLIVSLLSLTAVACRPDVEPKCLPCSEYLPSTLGQAGGTERCPATANSTPASGSEVYENLVFQGGGVKGIAYGGALPAFGDSRLESVERAAGTSAGAITAMAVSLGYTTDEVCELSLGVQFENFEDGSFPGDVVRLFEDYGWYKGDYALCLLECVVEHKTGSKDTTFAELHAKRQEDPKFKDLFVFGTDVNTHRSVEFSHRIADKRDVPLAKAARISMSIPFFFAAQEFEGNDFVDGGVLRNYPLDVFDGDQPNPSTLGFHLGAEPSGSPSRDLLEFTEDVVSTVLNDQVDRTCRTPGDVRRSIFINTLGVSATDFDLSEAKKLDLVEQGRLATERYLNEAEHPETCPVFVEDDLPPARTLWMEPR